MSSNPQVRLSDSQDAAIAEYHPLSKLAVVGLIFGVLSPVAIVDPLMWTVPPVGIVVSGLALWQIAREAPALIGRKAALIGLMLSILFGTAVPTQWFGYRWLLRREASRFADAWFELIGQGEPHKAYQLTLNPQYRQPLDEKLWKLYREAPYWRKELKDYVAKQPVRTLLALGTGAQIRYYDIEGFDREQDREVVHLLYAVSYESAGEKTTFFVGLTLERVKLETGRANWRLARAGGDLLPKGW